MDQSADQNEIFYGMIVKFRKAIKKIFPVVAVILLIAFLLSRVFTADRSPAPEIRISAHEAKDHVNTPAEVCGEVASTAFVEELEGQPTFINFERPHPEQVFTVVIWGEYRQQWQNPPAQLYRNQSLCVTGRIVLHNEIPQISVRTPGQVRIR